MSPAGHESFCLYRLTGDSRDLRPVSCGACGLVWAARRREPELTCWGVPAGSKANGIANLAWLLVLAAAVVLVIVYSMRA
jgi:hypothetical protein